MGRVSSVTTGLGVRERHWAEQRSGAMGERRWAEQRLCNGRKTLGRATVWCKGGKTLGRAMVWCKEEDALVQWENDAGQSNGLVQGRKTLDEATVWCKEERRWAKQRSSAGSARLCGWSRGELVWSQFWVMPVLGTMPLLGGDQLWSWVRMGGDQVSLVRVGGQLWVIPKVGHPSYVR